MNARGVKFERDSTTLKAEVLKPRQVTSKALEGIIIREYPTCPLPLI
jgi:hypothetical protein